MNIKAAICSHLRNQSSVSVLVGSKVYQNRAPRNAALPFIVVERFGANRPRHLLAGTENIESRVQISCYAAAPNTAEDIAEAVRLVMHGMLDKNIGHDQYRGQVKSVTLEDTIDLYDEPTDGSNVGADSVRQTWSIWHYETVPTFTAI